MNRPYYPALDGLRGLAAILVLCFHAFAQSAFPIFPRGYLAVDFFYALSGFVLAEAYLGRSISLRVFTVQRMVRLYPALILAAVISAVVHGSRYDGAVYLAQALVIIPVLSEKVAYPANGAVWSMFSEFVANAVFILILRRDTLRRCYGLCVIGAAGLICAAVHYHTTGFGPGSSELFVGLFRISFFFPLGVAMQQRFRGATIRAVPLAAPAALLTVVLAFPQGTHNNLLVDLACCFLLIPACLWFGAQVQVSLGAERLCRAAGLLSYPLYLVHVPVLAAVEDRFGQSFLACSAASIASLLVGIIATWCFDVPVRIQLATHLRRRSRTLIHAR